MNKGIRMALFALGSTLLISSALPVQADNEMESVRTWRAVREAMEETGTNAPDKVNKDSVDSREKAESSRTAADEKTPAKADETPSAEKTKTSEAAVQPETKKLHDLDFNPLTDADFHWQNVALGDSISVVEKLLGMPDKIEKGPSQDVLSWDGVSAVIARPLPSSVKGDRPSGLEQLAVTGTENKTVRGIAVGDSRENVLRAYGRPGHVFWDGNGKVFYLVYRQAGQMLIFEISDDKVKTIAVSRELSWLTWNDNGYMVNRTERNGRPGMDDVTLAGFKLGEEFNPHAWDVWEKKMTGPAETIWYYPGYGVRELTKSHLIQTMFITDHRMMTNRGLSVGDQKSTVEFLYGAPQKIETSTAHGVFREAYIYFPENTDNVLIIYLRNGVVDSIVVTRHNVHASNQIRNK
jgi:hypothetical protein